MARAGLIAIGHLACYDKAKEKLLQLQDNAANIVERSRWKENQGMSLVMARPTAAILQPGSLGLHTFSALAAAAVASLISNPCDVIKTRTMKAVSQNGKSVYSGPLNCLMQTVRSEGILALWKGLGSTFSRQGPYVVLTWIFVERIRQRLPSRRNKDDGIGQQLDEQTLPVPLGAAVDEPWWVRSRARRERRLAIQREMFHDRIAQPGEGVGAAVQVDSGWWKKRREQRLIREKSEPKVAQGK